MFYIRPYNSASTSMRAIKAAFPKGQMRQIGIKNSIVYTKDKDMIINWGATDKKIAPHQRGWWLNHPEDVAQCTNKLKFFKHMEQMGVLRIPLFTTHTQNALDMLVDTNTIVCRKLLTSHSGKGIELYTREDLEDGKHIPIAPLYTSYIPKNAEYRVHLANDPEQFGKLITICIQEKKRKIDHPDDQVNWQVRNLANGFIYAQEHVEAPQDVIKQAEAAFIASNLTFGAVDVIYNQHQQKAYILEINTAPGLAGRTLTAYVDLFKRYKETNDKAIAEEAARREREDEEMNNDPDF